MYAILTALPRALRLPRLRLPPVARWRQIRRERQHLLALSPHMLRDVGLTEAEVRREAARPFWDAPPR